MQNNFIEILEENIKLEQQNSPILFVGENLDLVNQRAYSYASEILEKFNIPNSYLYKLEDNGEKIKIEGIKNFLNKSNSKPGYKIQIFLIENFSRSTLGASNSCLKIFEEPGIYNIFFLTNSSEAGILDTILSRCKTINLNIKKSDTKNEFYYDLIKTSTREKKPQNLINYFFQNKLDKNEYISFLDNLIIYIKNELVLIDMIDEIFEDKIMIENNNVIARNVVDKWILKLFNYE